MFIRQPNLMSCDPTSLYYAIIIDLHSALLPTRFAPYPNLTINPKQVKLTHQAMPVLQDAVMSQAQVEWWIWWIYWSYIIWKLQNRQQTCWIIFLVSYALNVNMIWVSIACLLLYTILSSSLWSWLLKITVLSMVYGNAFDQVFLVHMWHHRLSYVKYLYHCRNRIS